MFGVYSSGFGVLGSGFEIESLRFRVWGETSEP